MFFRNGDESNFDISLQELNKQRNELLNIIKQHHGEDTYNHYKKNVEEIVDDLFKAITGMYEQINHLQKGDYENYDISITPQEDMDSRVRAVMNLSGNNEKAKQVTDALQMNYFNTKKNLQDLLPEAVKGEHKFSPMD